MKSIQNIASLVFIIAVAVLSVVSIMGIWEVFDRDVIIKSFQTLGLLAGIAMIVMAAGHFIEGRSQSSELAVAQVPSPLFIGVRRMTLVVLIVSVSVLALLGVMAIWELISDKDVLYKSIGSVTVLAFAAFIIVLVCLVRERNPILHGKGGATSKISIVTLIIIILAAVYLGRLLLYWRW